MTTSWKIFAQLDNVVLGEGPVWSTQNGGELYWIDIDGCRVHRTHSSTGVTQSVQLTSKPGCLGLVDQHPSCIWIACADGIHLLDWKKGISKLICNFPASQEERFNDGKIDPTGKNLVATTMITESNAEKRKGQGKLWSITPTAGGAFTSKLVKRQMTVPNGMDWIANSSSLSSSMYLVDTPTRKVDQFAYEPGHEVPTTTLSSFSTGSKTETKGEPDGLVLDRDGMIWVAMNGSSRVCRFTPKGELLSSIELPVSKVTSLCFGGENWSKLYVTSAAKGVDRKVEPLAGAVFEVALTNLPTPSEPKKKLPHSVSGFAMHAWKLPKELLGGDGWKQERINVTSNVKQKQIVSKL